jgi:hypothetical protein
MVTTEHALSPCNGDVEKFAATASTPPQKPAATLTAETLEKGGSPADMGHGEHPRSSASSSGAIQNPQR